MGKIIFSNDFITYTATARNANSSYPAANVAERWSLPRLFKCADATANDALLTLDMSSVQTVAAIFLNHVNFTSVTIQGNDTDSWGSPSFTTTVSVSQDPIVDRYKAFIPLTAFNYRYLRIFIPSGQTPTDDTVWYIGGIELLDSYETLVKNPAKMSRSSNIPFDEVSIGGRVVDIIETGTLQGWTGSLSFGAKKYADEGELWTLNNLAPGTPLVLYENLSDTSRAYLVRKAGRYTGTIRAGLIIDGNSIEFEEIGV